MSEKGKIVEIDKTMFLDAMWNYGFLYPTGAERDRAVYMTRIKKELGKAQRAATIRRLK